MLQRSLKSKHQLRNWHQHNHTKLSDGHYSFMAASKRKSVSHLSGWNDYCPNLCRNGVHFRSKRRRILGRSCGTETSKRWKHEWNVLGHCLGHRGRHHSLNRVHAQLVAHDQKRSRWRCYGNFLYVSGRNYWHNMFDNNDLGRQRSLRAHCQQLQLDNRGCMLRFLCYYHGQLRHFNWNSWCGAFDFQRQCIDSCHTFSCLSGAIDNQNVSRGCGPNSSGCQHGLSGRHDHQKALPQKSPSCAMT